MKVKETLRAADYEVYKMVRSSIDPSKKINTFDYRYCPKCYTEYDTELEHCEGFECQNCGLKMTMMGASLQCEMEMEEDS